ncbi:hypothetical protein TNCV_2684781 [Trichonephila clavipes]|nr:hypothetical protein TNCV_2684781 [Trichonephila clavipes]
MEELRLYNAEDCDSTLHLAFAPLPYNIQTHRFTITKPSYCMEELRLYNAEDCDATLHLAFAPLPYKIQTPLVYHYKAELLHGGTASL